MYIPGVPRKIAENGLREMQDAEQAFEDARQHLPHGCMMP